jgi:hypothetical protein
MSESFEVTKAVVEAVRGIKRDPGESDCHRRELHAF